MTLGQQRNSSGMSATQSHVQQCVLTYQQPFPSLAKGESLRETSAEKLDQDNAPVYITLYVKQFLADKHINLFEHPPYSQDLAPYDFYRFLKGKNVLKRTHFQSVDEGKAKTEDLLKMVTPNEPTLLSMVENSYVALY
ncbi:hypothetical protein TNCV_2834411 [Trichonephila clavipes]|nr:hypothetical protein TNCV_2834411 [Trichonephila clavipes]